MYVLSLAFPPSKEHANTLGLDIGDILCFLYVARLTSLLLEKLLLKEGHLGGSGPECRKWAAALAAFIPSVAVIQLLSQLLVDSRDGSGQKILRLCTFPWYHAPFDRCKLRPLTDLFSVMQQKRFPM